MENRNIKVLGISVSEFIADGNSNYKKSKINKQVIAQVRKFDEYYEIFRPISLAKYRMVKGGPDKGKNLITTELWDPPTGKMRTITERQIEMTEIVVDYREDVDCHILIPAKNFVDFEIAPEVLDKDIEERYINEVLNVNKEDLPDLPFFNVNFIMKFEPIPEVYKALVRSGITEGEYATITLASGVKKYVKVKSLDTSSKTILFVINLCDMDLLTKANEITNISGKEWL